MTRLTLPTVVTDLPAGPFGVVYADPPWLFAANSEAKPGKGARRHYPCMSMAQLMALPVADIAAPDAILLLWTTVPFRHRADDLVRAWGFRSVSELTWPKGRIGTGYWARNAHEPCIIAKRGRIPCPRPALFPTSIIPGKAREHSRKPEWVQDQIDARLPHLSKVELFGRRQRAGWTVWGAETEKFSE